MKIDAVAVTSSNMKNTVEFYTLLGFAFPKVDPEHTEPETPNGSARLMIDSVEMITDILGEVPMHGNHSSFAISFNSAEEVNQAVDRIKKAGFKISKEAWDAPWGQRYAIVQDPDGYKVDLYAQL